MLDKARLSIDDVTVRTLEYKLDSSERLDRMLASTEARASDGQIKSWGIERSRYRGGIGGGAGGGRVV